MNHRFPVRHSGPVEVIAANNASHDYSTDWAPRCARCGCESWAEAADYACGADVPMRADDGTITGFHNFAAAWAERTVTFIQGPSDETDTQ